MSLETIQNGLTFVNRTHYILANGLHFEYVIQGKAGNPYLLCLHSLATSWAVWDGQIDELSRSFRVIRLNLRGHGRSEGSAPPYSIELLVNDVIAILDELKVEKTHIMGLSIGGMIAMGIAIHHPSRVDRLIVADARAETHPEFIAVWDNSIALLKSTGMEAVVDLSLGRWFSQSFQESCPNVVEKFREIASATSSDGFIGCARAVQDLGYISQIGVITAQTFFIVGEEDRAATPTAMRLMSDQVAGSEFTVIPGAAHLTSIESPNIFTALVMNFLENPTLQLQ